MAMTILTFVTTAISYHNNFKNIIKDGKKIIIDFIKERLNGSISGMMKKMQGSLDKAMDSGAISQVTNTAM